jgi:hypothetical protein
LASAWRLNGGQSPYYLQSILQQNGFNLFVYDWWLESAIVEKLTMSGAFAAMGGERAKMGSQFGIYPRVIDPRAILQPPFYPLVNKITEKVYKHITMSADLEMGEARASMGSLVLTNHPVPYAIPDDSKYWRHFIYIAGSKIETPGVVKLDRKNELEELILSIFPAAKWVGMRVNYV